MITDLLPIWQQNFFAAAAKNNDGFKCFTGQLKKSSSTFVIYYQSFLI